MTIMDKINPLTLIGRLVDQRITEEGWTKGNAALRIGLSDPTLRLMRKGDVVSDRFYGPAEKALGLPAGLLTALKDGPPELIEELAAELAPRHRAIIAPAFPHRRPGRNAKSGT